VKTVRYLSILTFLVMVLSAFTLHVTALTADSAASDNSTAAITPPPAPEPEPVPADNVTFNTEFPTLEAVATGTFSFNVDMVYTGAIQRVFDLKASVPSGWDVYIEPQYEAGKRISSITIDSSFSSTTKQLRVVTSTPSNPPPDPGQYKILLSASSGNVTSSIQLIAKITAKYAMGVAPTNQRYDTGATAGHDNIFSIQVTNLGSAPVDTITFNSTHPDGWEIKFTPDKLDQLPTTDPKPVDVNIKPPPKTVAGDYMISLTVSGKQASAEKIDIRVTVNTPTIWGWVGVIIIVIVVVGLLAIFMRFGRR
jgi:uncharacterized membrane protein